MKYYGPIDNADDIATKGYADEHGGGGGELEPATSDKLGGIKLYTDAETLPDGQQPLKLDANSKAYVEVEDCNLKEFIDPSSGNIGYGIENSRSGSIGSNSVTFGSNAEASGNTSFALGLNTRATNEYSVAEGMSSQASAMAAHAEGNSVASGAFSHSEGQGKATADSAHAEGSNTTASGNYSHAEGYNTSTTGACSHAEGQGTVASHIGEHAQGIYNVSNTNTISSIGIGTADDARKNAIETMNDGRHFILGVGGYDGTNPDTARDLAKVLSQVEHFNVADVFTSPSGYLLDITKATSGNTVFVANGVAYAMLYFSSSISIGTAGWKPMLQWNNTWKYKIDNSAKANCAFRCCGSMWANNAYVNMAFDCYPDVDSGMTTTGIRSYYYNAIVNQTGGVNMSLIFPVVLR